MFFKKNEKEQQKSQNTSSLSKTTNIESCLHLQTVISKNLINCFFCGAHLPENSLCKVYKSKKQKFAAFMEMNDFLKSLQKHCCKPIIFRVDEPFLKQRNILIDYIFSLSEKLQFTVNTTYLAVYYLDFYIFRQYDIHPTFYPTYAIISLLLSAKAIELDERIPYFSKLIKVSEKNIKVDAMKIAEKNMLAALNWKLQIITSIDIIEYYLAQGIIFSTDEFILISENEDKNHINPLGEKNNYSISSIDEEKNYLERNFNKLSIDNTNENLKADVSKIKFENFSDVQLNGLIENAEYQCYRLMLLIIKDVSFLEKDVKIICASVIAYVRKISKIKNLWNDDLKNLSGGLIISDFISCFDMISSKFDKLFISKDDLTKNKINIKPVEVEKTQRKSSFFSDEFHFTSLFK